jgi:acid phosphatase
VPTLDNDGHDTSTPYVANYLTKTWLPRFQNETFMQGLAMLLTYDENETETEANHVYAALIGGAVNPKDESKVDATAYDHYSITKTVEENWALGSLGKNDVDATPIEI